MKNIKKLTPLFLALILMAQTWGGSYITAVAYGTMVATGSALTLSATGSAITTTATGSSIAEGNGGTSTPGVIPWDEITPTPEIEVAPEPTVTLTPSAVPSEIPEVTEAPEEVESTLDPTVVPEVTEAPAEDVEKDGEEVVTPEPTETLAPVEMLEQEIQANGDLIISGKMPEGVTAEVTDMMIATYSSDEQQILAMYDIVLSYEGEEYQPVDYDTVLTVTFTGLEKYNGSTVDVLHLTDDDEIETVVSGVEVVNGQVSFEASHFSIYAVVGGMMVDIIEEDALYKFTYSNGTNAIFYNNDLTELPALIFDGDLPAYASEGTGYLQNISSAYTNVDGTWVAGTVSNLKAYIGTSVKMYVKFEGATAIGKNAFRSRQNIYVDEDSFVGITTIGDYAFYGCSKLATLEFLDAVTVGAYAFQSCTSLTDISFSDSLTSIGNYAFDGCTALENVGPFSSSLTSIGTYVFNGCTALKEIDLGNTAITSVPTYTFHGCTSLESCILPATVTTLGTYAFQGCTALKDIDLSATKITTLPNYVFQNCSSLEACLLPTTVSSLGTYVFQHCKALEEIDLDGTAVKSIPNNTFYGCSSLQTCVLPAAATSIGQSAFSQCTELTLVVVPATLKTINTYAFDGCSKLTSLDLSATAVTAIPDYAFRNCSGLETFSFPTKVTTIGTNAFQNCSSLKSVGTIPTVLTSIGVNAFQNCSSLKEINFSGCTSASFVKIPDYAFDGCTALENVVLSSKITTLGAYAFANCSSLTQINIPKGLKSLGTYTFLDCISLVEMDFSNCTLTSFTAVGNSVFKGCSSLTTVKLSSYIKTFGASAFADCTSLTNINIPTTFYSLGVNAFQNCTSLTEIDFSRCTSTSFVKIGDYAFEGCTSLATIKLPSSIKTFGTYSFANCASLATINIPTALYTVDANAFQNCTSLIEMDFSNCTSTSFTTFSNYMFSGCTALETVKFPAALTTIGYYAFENCSSLQEINFSGCTSTSFTAIRQDAFAGCSSLKKVTLAPYVTILQARAFNGCEVLETINLGNVKTISEDVFKDCYYLDNIDLSAITSLDVTAFDLTEELPEDAPEYILLTGCSDAALSTLTAKNTSVYEAAGTEDNPTTAKLYYDYTATTERLFVYSVTEENVTGITARYVGDGVTAFAEINIADIETAEIFDDGIKTVEMQAEQNAISTWATTYGVISGKYYDMLSQNGTLTIGTYAVDDSISISDTGEVVEDHFIINVTKGELTTILAVPYTATSADGHTECYDNDHNGFCDKCKKMVIASDTYYDNTSYGSSDNYLFDVAQQSFIGYAWYINKANYGNTLTVKGVLPEDCAGLFKNKQFEIVDFSEADFSQVVNASEMFQNCDGFTEISLEMPQLQSASSMFRNCDSLTELNLNMPLLQDASDMFYNCDGFVEVDLSGCDFSSVINISNIFSECSNLTEIDLSNVAMPLLQDASSMFVRCFNLVSADLSGFINNETTTVYGMFYQCKKLTDLNVSNWNASGITDFSYMFYECTALTNIDASDWSTTSALDMSNMFHSCHLLAEINTSNWNTSSVTTMEKMFYNCESLTSIDMSHFNTENVTSMLSMFANCYALTNIDVSNFNVEKVTTMATMFYNCSALTSLDISNLAGISCTSFYGMFEGCTSLQEVEVNSNLVTASAKTIAHMFYGCSSLVSLDLSDWDVSGVTGSGCAAYVFNNCTSLKSINMSNWKGGGYYWSKSRVFNNVPLEEITFTTENFSFMEYVIGDVKKLYDSTYFWTRIKDEMGNEIVDDMAVNNTNFSDVTEGGTYKLSYPLNLYAGGGVFDDDSAITVFYYTDAATSLEDLALPVPTREGLFGDQYSFVGWTDRGWINGETYYVVPVDGSAPVGEYKNLYAIWTDSTNRQHADVDGNGFCNDCGRLCIDPATMYTTDDVEFSDAGNYAIEVGSCYASTGYYWTDDTSTRAGFAFYLNNKGVLTLKGILPEKSGGVLYCRGYGSEYGPIKIIDISDCDTSAVTDMQGMFYHQYGNFSAVEEIIGLDDFDTSNVTNMRQMFRELSSLTSLDLSSFRTPVLKEMSDMFYGCSSLTSLDLSDFDTSDVFSLCETFRGCTSITSINTAGWDTSKVKIMKGAFTGCQSLDVLDLSHWDVSGVTDVSELDLGYVGMNGTTSYLNSFEFMFSNTKIKCLNLSGWDMPGKNVANLFSSAMIDTLNISGVTGTCTLPGEYTSTTGYRHPLYNTTFKTIIVNENTETNPLLNFIYSKYWSQSYYTGGTWKWTHDASGEKVPEENACRSMIYEIRDLTAGDYAGTWKLCSGNVTLNANGGSFPDGDTSKTYYRTWDETLTLGSLSEIYPSPVHTSGYLHAGYALTTKGTALSKNTVAEDGIIYYAIWTRNVGAYTVTNEYGNLVTVNGDDAETVQVNARTKVDLAIAPYATDPASGSVSKYDAVYGYRVIDEEGNEIEVDADGTFTMPESNVTVYVDYEPVYRMTVHSVEAINMEVTINRVNNPIYNFGDSFVREADEDYFYVYVAEGDTVTLNGEIVSDEYFLDRLWFSVKHETTKTYDYVENGQTFTMSDEMVKIEPKFGYKFHTVEYTTDGAPYVDANGNIAVSGTEVYTAGERGTWTVPEYTGTKDFKVIPTVINAADGYYLMVPCVFYYGTDDNYHMCDAKNITLDRATGELTVKNLSQSIVIYYTFAKVDITSSYVVTLPAMIELTIDAEDHSKMTADVSYSVTYSLPENMSIEISIPTSFTMTNQIAEELTVTSDKQKSTWTTATSGIATEADGSLTGTDKFVLTAPTKAGEWTGSLTVNIDVITE